MLYLRSDAHFRGVCDEFFRALKPGGLVACVEQVRRRDTLDERHCKRQRAPAGYVEPFLASGFELLEWRQLRQGRFPLIYFVRYGLIPRRWTAALARMESRLRASAPLPVFDYADALFVFRRPGY